MQHHHYSLTEIDLMMPWEREIYVTMLVEDMKQREAEQKSKMA